MLVIVNGFDHPRCRYVYSIVDANGSDLVVQVNCIIVYARWCNSQPHGQLNGRYITSLRLRGLIPFVPRPVTVRYLWAICCFTFFQTGNIAQYSNVGGFLLIHKECIAFGIHTGAAGLARCVAANVPSYLTQAVPDVWMNSAVHPNPAHPKTAHYFKVVEIACFITNVLCSLTIITGFSWILMAHRNKDRVGGAPRMSPEMIRFVLPILVPFSDLACWQRPVEYLFSLFSIFRSPCHRWWMLGTPYPRYGHVTANTNACFTVVF